MPSWVRSIEDDASRSLSELSAKLAVCINISMLNCESSLRKSTKGARVAPQAQGSARAPKSGGAGAAWPGAGVPHWRRRQPACGRIRLFFRSPEAGASHLAHEYTNARVHGGISKLDTLPSALNAHATWPACLSKLCSTHHHCVRWALLRHFPKLFDIVLCCIVNLLFVPN